ncbi:hypothetical protein F511_33905 [Dorcoceras hygrometricum]|uniref:Uncharacterized protein n=1 Tax=Dorcoceras hygrometricum TaxID=472368 RepID=A0A2Z7B881_9LAMI|nr:hypothetical protein F511_33905 [Dorcoceras hygrometricum]
MMKTLREMRADPEGASRSLHPSKGKKKASEWGERRKKHRHEEKTKESAQATVSKCPISEPRGTAGKAPEQQSTEAPYDFDLVKSVPDLASLEAASLHFMQALVWSGEVANRLTQAWDEVVMTRRSMDGVLDRHNDLMKQLEEIRAQKEKEDNDYSEEEHHALFLDVEKALADMPEDEDSEEGSSGREEAPPA